MASIVQAFFILVLAAVAAYASFRLHPQAPALHAVEAPLRADEVTLAQIQEKWQGNVIWLDARPKDQYEKEHVPEAHLLNEQGFDRQLLDVLDVLQKADKPVVIYCGGERCEASHKVKDRLVQMVPIENCFVLKGGWPAWTAAQAAKAEAP